MNNKNLSLPILVTLASLLVTACGGGGGGGNTNVDTDTTGTTTTDTTTEVVYTAGTFEASSEYQHQCNAPREGIDPYTDAPYPDVAGNFMAEKMYLRSFSDETYLWYSEIADIDPTPYSVESYFDRLKTTARTESGTRKDKYHFSRNTAEYKQETRSGASYGFGFNWYVVSSAGPNREWYISYTENNSPASENNVQRGDRLMKIDGLSFLDSNNTDVINAGLFPSNKDETHTFEFQRVNGETYEMSGLSAEIPITVVDDVKVLTNSADRKVGYYRFNSFISPGQDPLIAAYKTLSEANVSELIVDLRYNGGGLLAMSAQMAYMVAGPEMTAGKVYEQSTYNDKQESDTGIGFYDFTIDWEAGVALDDTLPSVNLERVYVLTTDGTCSASEAFINGLSGIDVDVRLIGDTTCGKPYGYVPQDNCGTTYFTIQFKGANAKGFGDYGDGFTPTPTPSLSADLPGCLVEDDISLPLGTEEDPLVSAALQHMVDGSCPAVDASRFLRVDDLDRPVSAVEAAYNRSRTINKIYTPIKGIH